MPNSYDSQHVTVNKGMARKKTGERSRIARLTAIITQLQARQLLTAAELSKKFDVSIRTVYRDIRTLEEAGVPVYTEEGKGYTLVDGYTLPPVTLNETEANALITAERFVLKSKDTSFIREYTEAIAKIKSVLRRNTRAKADFLSTRMEVRQNEENDRNSNLLSILQISLTNFNLVQIDYASSNNEKTLRTIEPFALYNAHENWILIAKCRLRNDYRSFRLDRIKALQQLDTTFEPHDLTLPEYFEICRKKAMTPDS